MNSPVKIQSPAEIWHAWQADLDRYVYIAGGKYPPLLIVLTDQGMWMSTQYRFSYWVHHHLKVPVVRPLMKVFCAIWQKVIEIVTSSEMPNRAAIGGGLLISHGHGIFLHCDAVLGENCNLGHDVTIGVGGRGDKRGTPVLGDRVYVGPGAKIFGAIRIGNDVAIGANAVVTKDIPDNAVAVGIPAKVISYQGSRDFVVYRGHELDLLAEELIQEQTLEN